MLYCFWLLRVTCFHRTTWTGMQSKENAQMKLCTHHVITGALYFLLQDLNLQRIVNVTNPASCITLQCDYTSQTDTPAPVLITSSAVSHFWFTKIPFLDNWRHLLAFGFNIICPPIGAAVISRFKTERDGNSVWYVLRLRIPQEVPCTTSSNIKCFSYKTIPQITKKKKSGIGWLPRNVMSGQT